MEVPYKGPIEATLLDLLGGLRSACTYVGAGKLKELSKRTTFIRVTAQLNEVSWPAPTTLHATASQGVKKAHTAAARSSTPPPPPHTHTHTHTLLPQVFTPFNVKQEHGYTRLGTGPAVAGAGAPSAASVEAPPHGPGGAHAP